MMENRLLIIFSIFLTFLVSCQSMDDTFSELTKGHGERYVGKAKNIEIHKGWNRLKLTWENSVDPIRKKTIIYSKSETTADTIELSADKTEYITPATLKNETYEFRVVAVNEDGKHSLTETFYGKPLTLEDELINTIKRVEKKYAFVEDKLILIIDNANKEFLNATVEFTNGDEKKSEKIEESDFARGYIVYDGIEKNTNVSIKNRVKINGCFDEIDFDPYLLDRNEIKMDADFMNMLRLKYDLADLDNEFISSIETLYVDSDLNNLEDVIFLKNLKKIVIGGNKYYRNFYYGNYLTLQKTDHSAAIIDELNKIKKDSGKEFDIVIHTENYEGLYAKLQELNKRENYCSNPGIPSIPVLKYFEDMKEWSIESNYDIDVSQEYSNLFDNDQSTFWKPKDTFNEVRIHEICVDMKEKKSISGALFSQTSEWLDEAMPESIEIYKSETLTDCKNPLKDLTWISARLNQNIQVGNTRGEKSLITFPHGLNTRYLKIVVYDKITEDNTFVVIGDFIPYK